MIKFVDAGDGRGTSLKVEMTIFDLLSLQEGLTFAVIHLDEIVEKRNTEGPSYREDDDTEWKRGIAQQVHQEFTDAFAGRAKDARANYDELERVRQDREEALSAVAS